MGKKLKLFSLKPYVQVTKSLIKKTSPKSKVTDHKCKGYLLKMYTF